MPPRFHVPPGPDGAGAHWAEGQTLDLPGSCVRHLQVLRLQPGDGLTLFDGLGGQWPAEVLHMGRSAAQVRLQAHEAVERELPVAVTLAVCMPANDRMDDLVEKATELGVAAFQPLMSQRSVLRLSGERAMKKQAHWQAVAVAACEQSGRNRVPHVRPVQTLGDWLGRPADEAEVLGPWRRWQLSVDPGALALRAAWGEDGREGPKAGALTLLSGPEGGLDPAEQAQAAAAGFTAVSLGPRTLRADTAPLAALAAVGVLLA